MSDDLEIKPSGMTKEAGEQALMEKAADLMEVVDEGTDYIESDPSCLEERTTHDDADDVEVDEPIESDATHPETKILNLGNSDDLKEFNQLQRAAADPEAPKLAITEMEKQSHEGSWTVYVTFRKVEYMQL